ncbi:MAG: hypothetical protein K6L75_04650 [Cellvibrionaceae bacterium]
MLPVKTVFNRIVGNTNTANPSDITQIMVSVVDEPAMSYVEGDILQMLNARDHVPAERQETTFNVRCIKRQ